MMNTDRTILQEPQRTGGRPSNVSRLIPFIASLSVEPPEPTNAITDAAASESKEEKEPSGFVFFRIFIFCNRILIK